MRYAAIHEDIWLLYMQTSATLYCLTNDRKKYPHLA